MQTNHNHQGKPPLVTIHAQVCVTFSRTVGCATVVTWAAGKLPCQCIHHVTYFGSPCAKLPCHQHATRTPHRSWVIIYLLDRALLFTDHPIHIQWGSWPQGYVLPAHLSKAWSLQSVHRPVICAAHQWRHMLCSNSEISGLIGNDTESCL